MMNSEEDLSFSLPFSLEDGAAEWLLDDMLKQFPSNETVPNSNNTQLTDFPNAPMPCQLPTTVQPPANDYPYEAANQMIAGTYPEQTRAANDYPDEAVHPMITETCTEQPQAYPDGANQMITFDGCHKMTLQVSYQKIAVGEGGSCDMDSQDGFMLFYEHTFPNMPPTVELFKLPPLTPGFGRSQKETELTMEVLNDLQKGLLIQYENGCIYATRYCRSHVFYWSTQQHDVKQTVKLIKKQKTMVFCIQSYLATSFNNLNSGHKIKEPSIVFTFGQQWNGSSCNLKDMLVYAEVKLHKVVEKILNLLPNQSVLQSVHRSITASDIQKSLESTY